MGRLYISIGHFEPLGQYLVIVAFLRHISDCLLIFSIWELSVLDCVSRTNVIAQPSAAPTDVRKNAVYRKPVNCSIDIFFSFPVI